MVVSVDDIVVAKVESFVGLVLGEYGGVRDTRYLSVFKISHPSSKAGFVAAHDGHGGHYFVSLENISFVFKPDNPFYEVVKNILK